jgi:hypothetical protein
MNQTKEYCYLFIAGVVFVKGLEAAYWLSSII